MPNTAKLVYTLRYRIQYREMMFVWDTVDRIWYGAVIMDVVCLETRAYVTDDYGNLILLKSS